MTLFWKLWTAFNAMAEIAKSPEAQAVLAKLRAWFESLSPVQQLAVASQFEEFQGYGNACCPDGDCPDCPDECKEVFAAMVEAAKAA